MKTKPTDERRVKPLLKNNCKRHKGAQLVEFAFILPFLLVFVIGIIEFGRGFNIYHNVTNAAREGARLSSTPGNNVSPLTEPTKIRDRVITYMTDLGLQTSYYSGAGSPTDTPEGTIAWTYGNLSGAYLQIDQRSQIQARDSSGSPLNGVLIGSRVTLTYPYDFYLFKGVVNLLVPTTAYNNQIYIKNTAVIQNQ